MTLRSGCVLARGRLGGLAVSRKGKAANLRSNLHAHHNVYYFANHGFRDVADTCPIIMDHDSVSNVAKYGKAEPTVDFPNRSPSL